MLKNLQSEIVENRVKLLIKFLKDIFSSLYHALAKYVMEKKYFSIYGFSFYVGFFSLIILLIVVIFDFYVFNWYDYKKYFDEFNYIELLS